MSKGKFALSFWDTGIGVGADDATRIFQPFTQLNSGLPYEYPGTGVGRLSLVKRYTELHGGTVAVESKVNEGSRFIVRIPCSVCFLKMNDLRKGAEIAIPMKAPAQAQNGHESVVIIAEDNVVTRDDL
ncbi:MAG: hypothetical protein IPK16_09335 [Anaerolineales bacterium]|nr:hypothetical protein [Anaerolineales bacterium]